MKQISFTPLPQGSITTKQKIWTILPSDLVNLHALKKYYFYLTALISLCFLSIIFTILHNIVNHATITSVKNLEVPKQTSTGAILTDKTQEQLNFDTLIDNLLALTPLNKDGFIISFSYEKNAFIVSPSNNNSNYQELFANWLNTTEYKTIPSNLFRFSTANE